MVVGCGRVGLSVGVGVTECMKIGICMSICVRVVIRKGRRRMGV